MTRPIDADAIYKWYLDAFKGQIKPDEIRFSINDIRDNLQNIPTIDAVPVKHGLWLPTYEYHGFDDEVKNLALACSVCQVAFRISDYAQIEDFRYCPNCGADMRGEE